MAIPRNNARYTSSRATRTFIMGMGDTGARGGVMTTLSTAATLPQSGSVSQSQRGYQFLGTTTGSINVVIPATVAVNVTQRINFQIPLTQLVQIAQGYSTQGNLLTGNRNLLSTKSASILLFTVHVSADITDTTLTFSQKGVMATAVGVANNQQYNGPQLPTGLMYTNFFAVGTLSVFSAAIEAVAGAATIYATGSLAASQQ